MDAKNIPARWRTKLEALARAADESRDLAKGASVRIASTEREVERAERRRREIAEARSIAPEPGRDTAADARAQLEEAEQRLADAKRRLAEEKAAHRLHGERQSALRANVRAVERIIADHGPRLVDVDPVEPDLAPAETLADALERVRADLPPLRQKLVETRAAGLPPAELKRRARAHVEWLAEQGRPRLEQGEDGVSVLWPGRGEQAHTTFHPNNPDQSPACFAAWLAPDALLARLGAEIDAMPRDGLTLSPKEKAAKVAELEAAILDGERAEEALVERALAGGFNVQRRPDADPRAVLGVAISDKAVKEAA